MANLQQVLVAPNDSEATSWWLAFSEDGNEPFYVLPTVAHDDGPAAVEAVFSGEVEPALWDNRTKKDGGAGVLKALGAPRGTGLPSIVLYKRNPRVPEPNRPTLHTSLNHHDHEVLVWWHPTMQRRICGLCYPNAEHYEGEWLNVEGDS